MDEKFNMDDKNFNLLPISFMTNPSIVSRFPEETPVVLEKDYTEIDPFCSPYLTKNAVGMTIQCSLSKYTRDPETGEYTLLVDNDEWCLIEIITPVADFDNSEGWVKAKDLFDYSNISDEDLASRYFKRE